MNVTGNGVFVDVNCEALRVQPGTFLPSEDMMYPGSVEVRGYVSPMDIDLNATPDGLYKGFEAKIWQKIWSVTSHYIGQSLQIFGIIPFNYRWLCTLSRCTWRNDKCGFKLNFKSVSIEIFEKFDLSAFAEVFDVSHTSACKGDWIGVILAWMPRPRRWMLLAGILQIL